MLPRTRSRLEMELGMLYYSEERRGIKGRVRQVPEDFIVEEISLEGRVVDPDLTALDRGSGGYTLAVLRKRSRDLLQLIAILENRIGARIGYAGIKDRNAVTSQLISVDRPLGSWSPPNDIDGVEIRIVGTSRWPIKPGDLLGNRFTITIRGIDPLSGDAPSVPRWLPNYYGHQRFGVSRPNTHKVGKLILKRDFEGAVREFLSSPYSGEPEETRSLRLELSSTWDLRTAERSFPKALNLERLVIRRLIERPDDYENALSALPFDLRRLFINAYQSYLFNLALSRRLELVEPFDVLAGDFVSPLDRSNLPSRPIVCDGSNQDRLKRLAQSRRAVTMVPIPGYRSNLRGIYAEIYRGIFDSEGISHSDFEGLSGYQFEGTLRPSIFWPSEFAAGGYQEDELNPGAQKLTLRMSLPKGSYATLVLRELMRPEDPAAAGF